MVQINSHAFPCQHPYARRPKLPKTTISTQSHKSTAKDVTNNIDSFFQALLSDVQLHIKPTYLPSFVHLQGLQSNF